MSEEKPPADVLRDHARQGKMRVEVRVGRGRNCCRSYGLGAARDVVEDFLAKGKEEQF